MRKSGPRSGSPMRDYLVSDNPLLKRGPYSISRYPDNDRIAGTTRCIVTATSRNHKRCKHGIVNKTTYAPSTTRVKSSYRPLVRSDRIQGPVPRQVRPSKTIRGLCTNEDEKVDKIIIPREDNVGFATRTRKKSFHLAHTPMPHITVLATRRRRSSSPNTRQPQKGTVKNKAAGNDLMKLTRKIGIENPQPQVIVDEQFIEQTVKRHSEPETEKARMEEITNTKTKKACEEPEIIECKCPEPKPMSRAEASHCPPTIMTLCDECNNRNGIGKKIITSCEVTEAHYLSFDPPDLPDIPAQGSTATYCISHVMGMPQKQQPRRCKNNYDNLPPTRQSQCAGPWNRHSYNNSYASCSMSNYMQQQPKVPRNSNYSCVSQHQLQQQQQMYPQQQQQQPMYQHQQESMCQQQEQQRQQQQKAMCQQQQQYQQLTKHLQQQHAKQAVYQYEQPTLGLTELLAQQLQQHMEVSQNKIPSYQSSPRSQTYYCPFDNQAECDCALTDQTEASSCCGCSCSSAMADDNSPDKWNEVAESQRCQRDISVKLEDAVRCPEKCNVTFHESAFCNPHLGQSMAFTSCNMPTTGKSAPTANNPVANPSSDAFSRSVQPQQFNAQIQYPSQQAQNLYQLNMHPNNHYFQHQPCCWQRYAQMRFMMPRFWPCQ